VRFSRIILENWRNFGHVDVRLQNRAFLVGPNGSGKSNFLDVFRFLRDLVISPGGFEYAVNSRGGISRLRNLAARHPSTDIAIDIEYEGGDTKWRYRMVFTQKARHSNQPILREESIWRNDALVLSRPDQDDKDDPARLGQTHLEQTFANREFRAIADFFNTIQYFHLVPQLVRDPERSLGREADPYGGDFLEQIARTSPKAQQVRLRRILSALKVAVPQLRELKLEKDERGTPHLYGNYEHWRPTGAWQSENDLSDGTLRLMGLLWSLLDGAGPLLLEEPELSLHAEVVRRIPQMMWRIQKAQKRAIRQVFLSTHSRDLLWDEGIAPDEVLLFKPSKEGSEVHLGAEIEEIRRLLETGLTVAEVIIPHTRPDNLAQLSLFGE
jgi:predicted ATPase